MLTHDAGSVPPTRLCAPRARCRNWRDCEACARIRQAKIADAAERLERYDPELSWTCLKPVRAGAAALIAARAEWLRRADPPGAIWTVEQSPTTGNLHLNIIAPTDAPPVLAHSAIWQQRIEGEARNVAAYIAKRSQMPRRADFSGRLYGTCGPLWSWLANGKQEPLAAGAALQYEIDHGHRHPARPTTAEEPPPPALKTRIALPVYAEPTREEYRAIAARRLPDIISPLGISTSNFNDRLTGTD